MKLQKIIMYAAVALTAFGVSLGVFEIAGYLGGFRPFEPFGKGLPPVSLPKVDFPPLRTPSRQPEVSAVSDAPPTPEKDYCEFSGSGDYYLIDENLKSFTDIDTLSVTSSVYDQNLEKDIAIKPMGSLWTTKEFKFSWVNVTKKRLSFITRSKKGVSYQFDGKFVDEAVKPASETDDSAERVALRGRLTKWRGGVRVAEAKVRFGESCGC